MGCTRGYGANSASFHWPLTRITSVPTTVRPSVLVALNPISGPEYTVESVKGAGCRVCACTNAPTKKSDTTQSIKTARRMRSRDMAIPPPDLDVWDREDGLRRRYP